MDTVTPEPKHEILDGPVRDLLIDIAHRHYFPPPIQFAQLSDGTWDRFSLAGHSGTISAADSQLRLLIEANKNVLGELQEMIHIRNHPMILKLQDNTEVRAEFGLLNRIGEYVEIMLYHWTWTTPATPLVWVGQLVGEFPLFGNLSLTEIGDLWQASEFGFRLSGRYTWYILPKAGRSASVVIDTNGEPLIREVLSGDFRALEFTFGGQLGLDYLIGVDASKTTTSAMSLVNLERSRSNYRPPVTHELGETQIWIPEFFRLAASKLSADGPEPLIIAIASYLDAENDHLDGAYLKAQVGLEAFAKRIVSETASGILVKNETDWKHWVSKLESEIKEHLIDPKRIEVIRGKFISAMYAPSGDIVQKALVEHGVSLPQYVREEIKKRNIPAHGFLMNRTVDYDFERDTRRLEMIQTVLASLAACYIGYGGPICGYDATDIGERPSPSWWPIRSRQEDVWVYYVGARHVSGPRHQSRDERRSAVDAVSLERNASIRERAYFLWENRTGSAWWDATSNWIEAEGAECKRNDQGQT
ncbi:DUF2934 domain-containing protein [Sorangium sp. So ce1151]|uniref:DUF2934 domain-containing protein n=1 Tax=Sorangium sp. So ce1151 TaxID=3133332 RepID=UPI003F61D554